MRHRITFLKHVDDALWLVVRCARAVRFPVTKLNLGSFERTAVWGFLCEHRAHPAALNVRSAPARRARCGDRRRSVFPPRSPRRGPAAGGSAIRDGGIGVLPLGPFYARFASSRLARVFMRFPP